jgi:hypothetical protein
MTRGALMAQVQFKESGDGDIAGIWKKLILPIFC